MKTLYFYHSLFVVLLLKEFHVLASGFECDSSLFDDDDEANKFEWKCNRILNVNRDCYLLMSNPVGSEIETITSSGNTVNTIYIYMQV